MCKLRLIINDILISVSLNLHFRFELAACLFGRCVVVHSCCCWAHFIRRRILATEHILCVHFLFETWQNYPNNLRYSAQKYTKYTLRVDFQKATIYALNSAAKSICSSYSAANSKMFKAKFVSYRSPLEHTTTVQTRIHPRLIDAFIALSLFICICTSIIGILFPLMNRSVD